MDLWIILAAALGCVVMGFLTRRRDGDTVGDCGGKPSADGCNACTVDCENSERTDVRS